MPCPHFKISIRQRSKRQSAVDVADKSRFCRTINAAVPFSKIPSRFPPAADIAAPPETFFPADYPIGWGGRQGGVLK